MVAEIKRTLVIIEGNFRDAYRKLIESMYKMVEYVPPRSLDGTYMEPQIVISPSAMVELEMNDHTAELAKKITEGCAVEPFFMNSELMVLRSEPTAAQKIVENAKRIAEQYDVPLKTEVRVLPLESVKETEDTTKMPETDWKNLSPVGT
jgi:hypothetical protein